MVILWSVAVRQQYRKFNCNMKTVFKHAVMRQKSVKHKRGGNARPTPPIEVIIAPGARMIQDVNYMQYRS